MRAEIHIKGLEGLVTVKVQAGQHSETVYEGDSEDLAMECVSTIRNVMEREGWSSVDVRIMGEFERPLILDKSTTEFAEEVWATPMGHGVATPLISAPAVVKSQMKAAIEAYRQAVAGGDGVDIDEFLDKGGGWDTQILYTIINCIYRNKDNLPQFYAPEDVS